MPGSILPCSHKPAWSSSPGLAARSLLVIQRVASPPCSQWPGLQRQWKGNPDGCAVMQALSSSTEQGVLLPRDPVVTGGSNRPQRRKRRILRSRSPRPSTRLQGKGGKQSDKAGKIFSFPMICAGSKSSHQQEPGSASQGTVALPDVQPLGASRICSLDAVPSGSPRGQKKILQWPLLILLCSHLSPSSGLVGLGRDRKSSHCPDSSKRIRSRTDTS